MNYISKPQKVLAWQYTGDANSAPEWLKGPDFTLNDRGLMCVYSFSHDSWLDVPKGNWVVLNGKNLDSVSNQDFKLRFDPDNKGEDILESLKSRRRNG